MTSQQNHTSSFNALQQFYRSDLGSLLESYPKIKRGLEMVLLPDLMQSCRINHRIVNLYSRLLAPQPEPGQPTSYPDLFNNTKLLSQIQKIKGNEVRLAYTKMLRELTDVTGSPIIYLLHMAHQNDDLETIDYILHDELYQRDLNYLLTNLEDIILSTQSIRGLNELSSTHTTLLSLYLESYHDIINQISDRDIETIDTQTGPTVELYLKDQYLDLNKLKLNEKHRVLVESLIRFYQYLNSI